MKKHSRTLLALEILKEYNSADPYAHLTEDEIDEVSGPVVQAARLALMEEARVIIDEILLKINFPPKQIQENTSVDCGTISRLHNGNYDEVQMALPKLRKLVRNLRAYVSKAIDERLRQLRSFNQLLLTPIDFCPSGKITDETPVKSKDVVYTNLISGIAGKFDNRLRLPDELGGCLLRVGPPGWNLYIFQAEGASESQVLKHVVHELKHVQERLKHRVDEIEKDSKQQNRRKKPRSLYT